MKLRIATVADARALAVLGPATFIETFAHDHPVDDLLDFTESHHSTAYYTELLGDPGTSAWVVEHDGGTPIGYAILVPASLPGSDPATDAELKRIYLFSKWQGGGWGRALIEAVEAAAIARGAKRLVLSVYTKNDKAMQFYGLRGYETIGRATFPGFTEEFSDYVMAKTF